MDRRSFSFGAAMLSLIILFPLTSPMQAQDTKPAPTEQSSSRDGGTPIATPTEVVANLVLPPASPDSHAIPAMNESVEGLEQKWSWHVQSTVIVQGYPGLEARYSGANSLPTRGEARETISMDAYVGFRLWNGAEAHVDVLTWQGYGLNNTLGIEAFPNGEAYKAGTSFPRSKIARLFVRQTIGLHGQGENFVHGDGLTLAGGQDTSRLTFTIGRFSSLTTTHTPTIHGSNL